MNTNIRWLAAYTADIFDDYLAEIKLPIVCSDASEEEDRHSNENSAMLYGMEYWNLVEDIEAYTQWVNFIQAVAAHSYITKR